MSKPAIAFQQHSHPSDGRDRPALDLTLVQSEGTNRTHTSELREILVLLRSESVEEDHVTRVLRRAVVGVTLAKLRRSNQDKLLEAFLR